MPSSIKRAREYGDDLGLIFVESQGASAEGSEAFAWSRKWMGTSAMWTTERPFSTNAQGLPNFVLLSGSGEVLLMGNPLMMHKQIDETIEAEIAKAKQAPEGSPKSLKSAYKAFAKGDYAKAVAAARKVEAKGDEDADAARAAVATFVGHASSKLGRAERMIDLGYVIEAADLVDDLAKSTKGIEELDEQKSGLIARIETPEFEDEIDAAKALAKLEAKLNEDGFEEKVVKALKKFTEKNGGTKAATRAQHLVSISGT